MPNASHKLRMTDSETALVSHFAPLEHRSGNLLFFLLRGRPWCRGEQTLLTIRRTSWMNDGLLSVRLGFEGLASDPQGSRHSADAHFHVAINYFG